MLFVFVIFLKQVTEGLEDGSPCSLHGQSPNGGSRYIHNLQLTNSLNRPCKNDQCNILQHFRYIYNKKAVLSQRWLHGACYISGSYEPLRRYGYSKLSKMAACHQLGFGVTGNSAIRSADPENPTLEPNMKCIVSPPVDLSVGDIRS